MVEGQKTECTYTSNLTKGRNHYWGPFGVAVGGRFRLRLFGCMVSMEH
jgi:hypothetical protein